jgi:hypothetical protein
MMISSSRNRVHSPPLSHLRCTSLLLLLLLTLNSLTLASPHLEPRGVERPQPDALDIFCARDLFEPNNHRQRARNLTSEFQLGREVGATACHTDEDWYTFWLNRGQLVELSLHNEGLERLPPVHIYPPRHRKPSGILKRTERGQTLKVYAKKSGRYRLRVRGGTEVSTPYSLSLTDLSVYR